MNFIRAFSCFLVIVCCRQSIFCQVDKNAVKSFISRITNEKARDFVAEYISAEKGQDVFELESKKGKIILRGSNGNTDT